METTSPAGAVSSETPFEKILGRLEEVVGRLEDGELSLEESLKIFEEGVSLARAGNQRLDQAEQQVELLLSDGATQPLVRDGETE